MRSKIRELESRLKGIVLRMRDAVNSPRSERGEELASVAAITGLVLLVIVAVMAIFRAALIGAFNHIAALLGF